MNYDYYLHKSGGKVFDYFNCVGTPFRVSYLRWLLFRLFKFRATRVQRGASLKRVYIRATLQAGAHRTSYNMKETLKQFIPVG